MSERNACTDTCFQYVKGGRMEVHVAELFSRQQHSTCQCGWVSRDYTRLVQPLLAFVNHSCYTVSEDGATAPITLKGV